MISTGKTLKIDVAAQAVELRWPGAQRAGLTRLNWQDERFGPANQVEAPQVSAHAVPQNNWHTTAESACP